MNELETILKERIRAELKLCQIKDIDEYMLDRVYRISVNELFIAITRGSVAEYYLMLADYDKAEYHHKEYKKELKNLLWLSSIALIFSNDVLSFIL